jgi:hypothetical protein
VLKIVVKKPRARRSLRQRNKLRLGLMFELLRDLRALLEASTTGTLGHFRSRGARIKDKTAMWHRQSKLGRKHAAQHALGHAHAKGDVHDVHGHQHIHKGKVKATKFGRAWGGQKVRTDPLRKGANRHLAARSRLAKIKWKAHSQKMSWLKKKKKSTKPAKIGGGLKRKVAA